MAGESRYWGPDKLSTGSVTHRHRGIQKPQPSGFGAPAFLIKGALNVYVQCTHNTNPANLLGAVGGQKCPSSCDSPGKGKGLGGQPIGVSTGNRLLALTGSHLILLL